MAKKQRAERERETAKIFLESAAKLDAEAKGIFDRLHEPAEPSEKPRYENESLYDFKKRIFNERWNEIERKTAQARYLRGQVHRPKIEGPFTKNEIFTKINLMFPENDFRPKKTKIFKVLGNLSKEGALSCVQKDKRDRYFFRQPDGWDIFYKELGLDAAAAKERFGALRAALAQSNEAEEIILDKTDFKKGSGFQVKIKP